MKSIKAIVTLLLLQACRAKTIDGQINPVPEPAVPRARGVIRFQLDEGWRTLLPELRHRLLLPDPGSADVYFNPGTQEELLGLSPEIPDLDFRVDGYSVPLLTAKSWLAATRSGMKSVFLNLTLASPKTPLLPNRLSLIHLLRLRISEGPVPRSFSLENDNPEAFADSLAGDPSRPFFFTVEGAFPASSLFYQTCEQIDAYLAALQLTKGIKPEASIEVPLSCTFSLENHFESSSSTGLTLLSLPLPWKRTESDTPAFGRPLDFFDPEKYGGLKPAAQR
jgi:hypothetical protein